MKPKHETKHCPCCGNAFECKSGSILLCQCQTVLLSPEQLEYIAVRYDDCLCATCLLSLRKEYDQAKHHKRLQGIVSSHR